MVRIKHWTGMDWCVQIQRAALCLPLLAAAVCCTRSTPSSVAYWNASAATEAQNLTYEEQAVAFALQGLVNSRTAAFPALYLSAGYEELWQGEDDWWASQLQQRRNLTFAPVPPTLCALVQQFRHSVAGAVAYDAGDSYSLPFALTLAGQHRLLPVNEAALAKHACLRSLPIKQDLRGRFKEMGRAAAWDWAIKELLPNSSKTIVYNLNHYRYPGTPPKTWDPLAATLIDVDFAVQQNAFVMDFGVDCVGVAWTTTCPYDLDARMLDEVLAKLDPLFVAYGWFQSEFKWINATSVAGGSAVASLSTASLSFWATLPTRSGGRKSRPLPQHDRGVKLNSSKYYVTFVTNDGDTARIVGAAMGQAWPSAQRGSLPVAWALDFAMAPMFPALFDYFVSTAKQNDTFVAALAGAGYVFLNMLSGEQLDRFGHHVGGLLKEYGGSHVVDTYGFANVSTIERYSAAQAAGGVAASAYVSEPLYTNPTAEPFGAFHTPNDGNVVLKDGTLVGCAPASMFFYQGKLRDQKKPGAAFAAAIEKHARQFKPPYFVHSWGGIEPGLLPMDPKSPLEFWNLHAATLAALPEDFEVIGADDMARLSKEAAGLQTTSTLLNH